MAKEDLIANTGQQYKRHVRPEQDLLCFSDAELSEIVSNFMLAARLLNFLARQHDGTPNDTSEKDDFSFMSDP